MPKVYDKPIQLFANQIYMNRNDILSYIPEDIYVEIKRTNDKPIFAPYVIAHEGYSNPRIIGEGQTKIYWPRKAIESFKDLVKKGVKFFIGHNEDNSTNNRKEVGQVVGSFQKEVNGKLNQIAIAYFPDAETANNKVCSIEAIGEFFDDAGNIIADGIKELTGIALGINETPAFPETGQIGYIQAFEADNISDDGKSSVNHGGEPKGYKMGNLTLEEMKAQIVLSGWNPGQLFDMANIVSDTVFQNRLKEKKKILVDEKDYVDIKAYESQKTELENTKKDFTEKLGKYEKDILKNTSKTRYDEKIKTLNLTEKQKKYFDVQYNKLSEFTDEALDKFITDSQASFKELASAGLVSDTVQNVSNTQSTEKNPFIIED